MPMIELDPAHIEHHALDLARFDARGDTGVWRSVNMSPEWVDERLRPGRSVGRAAALRCVPALTMASGAGHTQPIAAVTERVTINFVSSKDDCGRPPDNGGHPARVGRLRTNR